MHERTAEQKNNYFRELALNLHREGFEVSAEENGLLPVGLEGQRLCQITSSGGVRHWREDITDEHLSEALERVTDIAELTAEYMDQLDAAPFLEVGSSADHYQLLADFNGTVLAGCQTRYGAQFITWRCSPDRTSLDDGHYYGPACGVDSYTAAKQDFAVRSGMIPCSALFTTEQLVEMYRSTQKVLESDSTLTMERENLLEEVCGKIQDCVHDLDELVQQQKAQEPGQGMEQSW